MLFLAMVAFISCSQWLLVSDLKKRTFILFNMLFSLCQSLYICIDESAPPST